MVAPNVTLSANSLVDAPRPAICSGARVHHLSSCAPTGRKLGLSVVASLRRDAPADAMTRERPGIVDYRTAAAIERARRLAADLHRLIIGITHSRLPVDQLASKERELGMLLHDVGRELMIDADRIDPDDDHAE
ncbi:hypothetical protein [Amycolatopsis sp. NPDC051102]|uniref:hypothetical protein n=1 Tax=Amycolatopsis sp. NPDC051102 TaxID=3155163 RepID=UPI003423DA98